MIKLNRGPKPQYLDSEKIIKEKERIKDSYHSESYERLKFRSELLFPIKKNLIELTKAKCGYCESSLGATSYFDIDHFRPKSGAVGLDKEYAPHHYFWLAYEWENLIPSCQLCSMSKKNIFPIKDGSSRASLMAMGDLLHQEQSLLIDPFYDDPSLHLHFGEDGIVKGLTNKGAITIEVLKLNRTPLVRARLSVAQNFISEILLLPGMSSQMKKYTEEKIQEIFSENSSHEYSALLRNIYKTYNPGNYWKETEVLDRITPLDQIIDNVFKLENEIASIQEITRFTIKSIEIQNFKSIDHLELNFLPTQNLKDRESWMLVLGDNGVGKSAILQAIALTLCDAEQFDRLKIAPADIFKWGVPSEDFGFVKIFSYENEEPYIFRFNEKEFISRPKAPPFTLLAYGAVRLLPKGKLRPRTAEAGMINIWNLFDYSFSLVDAKAWMLKQSEEDFETRIIPVLIDLLDIKNTTHFTRSADEVLVGNIKLSDISDGYKSMIAMACDIMSSLSIQYTRFHETPGIVLIDELGNHLHPKWRLRIVSSLRLAFPKLQFIVSTHEPLCLRGLDHGEVTVLTVDHEKKIKALDCSVLPDHNLLRIDQLLTSDLFGLLDTGDPETEKKFDRYYELLVKPEEERNEAENEEIQYYTCELHDKDIIGNTPQSQVMYQLINENFAKNLLENGFKTKEELKKDTIKDIQKLIEDKNLDWL